MSTVLWFGGGGSESLPEHAKTPYIVSNVMQRPQHYFYTHVMESLVWLIFYFLILFNLFFPLFNFLEVRKENSAGQPVTDKPDQTSWVRSSKMENHRFEKPDTHEPLVSSPFLTSLAVLLSWEGQKTCPLWPPIWFPDWDQTLLHIAIFVFFFPPFLWLRLPVNSENVFLDWRWFYKNRKPFVTDCI